MSELINHCDNRAAIRWKLLASASALALTAAISSSGIASAEDADNPPVWIELGGQYVVLDDSQQRHAPPFVALLPDTLPSPLPAQKSPNPSIDWNGKLSFEPDASGWVFSASVRYGRSTATGRVEKVLPPTPVGPYGFAGEAAYVQSKSYEPETHAVLDFQVGKDLGIGKLSGGVRVAQFSSGQTASITAFPSFRYGHSHNRFEGRMQAKRDFNGIGPSIAWDALTPIAGNVQKGEITFDWGANAALLFGRRKADIHHQTVQSYGGYSGYAAVYSHPGEFKRAHMATIPNLGGFAGLSMRYASAKISLGYRADEFFGAMGGGIATAKNENVGFYGPFASVAIGLGG
ncbi:MAG TPA: hypothetical protein VK759_05100 [Rhizomicrobium sp.]|nr:hypothetical protein [Rhizomicrobium sp.]